MKSVVVFTSPSRRWHFSPHWGDRVEVVQLRSDARLWRPAWYAEGLRRAVRHAGADCLFALAGAGAADVPTTILIQQSLPFSREGLQRSRRATRMRMAVIRAAMRASARAATFTAVQTRVMQDVVEREIGIPRERILCVPPRAPELQLPSAAARGAELATRGLLYVGSAAPYKNLRVLVDAAAPLKERGWRISATVAEAPGLNGLVTLGELTRDEVASALEGCDALVMPSLTETVGLPLLEAMAAGRPILAADRPYAHEICGDAALYFDPTQPRSLLDAVERLEDPQVRRRLLDAGRSQITSHRSSMGFTPVFDVLARAVLSGR